jgi:hypothetical protein
LAEPVTGTDAAAAFRDVRLFAIELRSVNIAA